MGGTHVAGGRHAGPGLWLARGRHSFDERQTPTGVFGTDYLMADYLTNLIAKSRDPAAGVRPRLTALFEPVVQADLAAEVTRKLQPVNDLLVENETVSHAQPVI